MTAPAGRRSGRRVLSWLLALALLGVIGFVVLRDIGGQEPEPAAPTVVTGVIGSEKEAFFADERVRDAFRAHGLELRIDPAGSRQIATTVRLDGYDFAFPSSSPAADKLLAQHPAARTSELARRVQAVTSNEAATSAAPNQITLRTPRLSTKSPPNSAPIAMDVLYAKVFSDIAASKVSGAAARVMVSWLSCTTP
jgi:hypothetical protein